MKRLDEEALKSDKMARRKPFAAPADKKYDPGTNNNNPRETKSSDQGGISRYRPSYSVLEGEDNYVNDKDSSAHSDARWRQHHEPEFSSAFYAIPAQNAAVGTVAPTVMHVYDSVTAASVTTRLSSSARENFEQDFHHHSNFTPHWQASTEGAAPLWVLPVQQQHQQQLQKQPVAYTADDASRRYSYYKADESSATNFASQADKSVTDACSSEHNNPYNSSSKRPLSASEFSYAGGGDGCPSVSDAGVESDNEQLQHQTAYNRQMRKRTKKESGERWNKRFTWPDDMHQKFIAAVFDVGFKHATPATVVQQMSTNMHEHIKDASHAVTTDSIKHHLIQYQHVHERYRREMCSKYFPGAIIPSPNTNVGALSTLSSLMSSKVLDQFSVQNVLGLHYSKLLSSPVEKTKNVIEADSSRQVLEQAKANELNLQEEAMFPNMTEEEKLSPLGTSIGLVMALMVCIKEQLTFLRSNSSSSSNSDPYSLMLEARQAGSSTTQRLTALSIQSGCKLLDTVLMCADSLVAPLTAHVQHQHTSAYFYGHETTTKRVQVLTSASSSADQQEQQQQLTKESKY